MIGGFTQEESSQYDDTLEPPSEESDIEQCEGCHRWVNSDDRKICLNCDHIGCINCMDWSGDHQGHLCDDTCLKNLEQKMDGNQRIRL